MNGTVYTETVIYSAPEAFVKDVPYQIAIITLEDGHRTTGRILGAEVSVGDPVQLAEERNGVPYFRKADE
ncbi:MAG: OB-fold domain-containing protein [Bryobacteraceae bacterium]